jgi:hypothetical protein
MRSCDHEYEIDEGESGRVGEKLADETESRLRDDRQRTK